MFGIRLIFLLAVLGGVIAFIADKLGSKIGKKKLRIFGLRPHDTSVLLTVLSGVLISLFSMGILAVSSESARTALFGMEKLQKELQQLNTEKGTVEEEYTARSGDMSIQVDSTRVNKRTIALAQVIPQYQETQGALVTARSEVQSLTEARDKLNDEIEGLKQETKDLQQGLAVMRGGQMMYRSGEIVFAGVLQGGLPEEENMKQINWMLDGANTAAMNRIGLDSSSKAEVVWLTREEVERLKDLLGKAKGNVLVRVRSVANTVIGQPVLCGMEVIPNRVIFKDGKKIHEKVIDLADKTTNADQALMTFLQEINERSVKEGVLPDPMTGKVGNINAVTVVDTVTKMQKMGGKIRITGYADGDITTAGPVQLRLGIEKVSAQP